MRAALLAAVLYAVSALNKHRLMCVSCKAVAEELLQLLHGSTSEMDIDHYLDGFCHPDRFGRYEFAPPDMFMGCQRFLAQHQDEFVAVLTRRGSNEGFPVEFCETRMGLCRAEEAGPESEISSYETYTVIHSEQ